MHLQPGGVSPPQTIVLCRFAKLGYRAISSASFASICADADRQLFTRLSRNSQHLLHPLHPEHEQHYSLRDRSHNYQLPDRTSTRVVVWGSNRRSTNSSNILEQLHWLPIERCIKFKIACITYKTVSTTQPAYLHSLLKHYVPSRTLRSSGSNLLLVPRVRTGFGSRSFSVAAPIIWNSLPLDIRNSSAISCFCRQLNFLLQSSFSASLVPIPPQPSASYSAGQSPTLCTLQIHLLTYLPNDSNFVIRMLYNY